MLHLPIEKCCLGTSFLRYSITVALSSQGISDAFGVVYFVIFLLWNLLQLTCYCMLSDALAHEVRPESTQHT